MQCVETHLQVERVEPRLGDRCWGSGVEEGACAYVCLEHWCQCLWTEH